MSHSLTVMSLARAMGSWHAIAISRAVTLLRFQLSTLRHKEAIDLSKRPAQTTRFRALQKCSCGGKETTSLRFGPKTFFSTNLFGLKRLQNNDY